MQLHTTLVARAWLPTEILDAIIQLVPRDALSAILPSNSVVYAIGCKRLYQREDLGDSLSPPKTILLLKTLSKSDACRPSYLPHPKSFLRFLTVNFNHCYITSNLLRLITRALLSIPHLQKLTLYLPQIAKLDVHWPFHGWVLDDLVKPMCYEFQTNLYCDAELKRFLEAQHDIRALTLLWDDDFYPDEEFELNPHALPSLQATMFRTDQGWPHDSLVRTLLKDRPIIAASYDLVAAEGRFEPFHIVATSGSCPLRTFKFTLQSAGKITQVVTAIASLMPDLSGLHLICEDAGFQTDRLLETSLPLRSMNKLHHIKAMMAGVDGRMDLDTQRNIVDAWANACPTLQYIGLSCCDTWFKQREEWHWRNEEMAETPELERSGERKHTYCCDSIALPGIFPRRELIRLST